MVFGFGSSSESSQPSSSSSTSTQAQTITSTSTSDPALTRPAPNREQRLACWESRDAYFACLDRNGMIQAGDELRGEGRKEGGICKGERGEYEKHCGKSWVDYFNKRRTLEARQKLSLDAAAKQGVKVPGR